MNSILSINSNNKRLGEELENPAKFAKTISYQEKAASYIQEAEKTQDLARRIECHKNAVIYDPANKEYCSTLRKYLISELKEKITKSSDFWKKLNIAIEIFGLDPEDRKFFQHTTFQPLTNTSESIENKLTYEREHIFLCPCNRAQPFILLDNKMPLEEKRRLQYFYEITKPDFLENHAQDELNAAPSLQDKMQWGLIAALLNSKNFRTIALPALKAFYIKEYEEKRLDAESFEKEIVEWLQALPSNKAQDELKKINSDLETKYLKPIQHYFRNETDTSKRAKMLFAKGLKRENFLTLCKGAFAFMPNADKFNTFFADNIQDIMDTLLSSYEKEPSSKTELQLTTLSGLGSQDQKRAIGDHARNTMQKHLENLVENGTLQEQHDALLDLCLLGARRADDIALNFASLATQAKSDQEKCLYLFYASYPSPKCYEKYHELFKQSLYESALKKETSSDALYAHLLYPNEITMQKLLSLREGFEAMQENYFTRWDKIDPALFHYLCSFLDIKDICRLMGVSQLFKNIISSKSFENSWELAFIKSCNIPMEIDQLLRTKFLRTIRDLAPDHSTSEKTCRSNLDMNDRYSKNMPAYIMDIPQNSFLLETPPVLVAFSNNFINFIKLNSGDFLKLDSLDFYKKENISHRLVRSTPILESLKNTAILVLFTAEFRDSDSNGTHFIPEDWILCYDFNQGSILTKKSRPNYSNKKVVTNNDFVLLIEPPPGNKSTVSNIEIYDPITGNSEFHKLEFDGKATQCSHFTVNQNWLCLAIKNARKKKQQFVAVNRSTKEIKYFDQNYAETVNSVSLEDTNLLLAIMSDTNHRAKYYCYDLMLNCPATLPKRPLPPQKTQLNAFQNRWKNQCEINQLKTQIVGSHAILADAFGNTQYRSFSAFDAGRKIVQLDLPNEENPSAIIQYYQKKLKATNN